MKSLLIFALAVHVTIIIVQCNGPTFGDILSFPRKCLVKRIPTYKHFALYVGNEYRGQGDIFHHVGENRGGLIIFGNLADEGHYKVENYLDDLKNDRIDTSKAAIKERIEALNNTGNYSLLYNNCEHAATYLRYGVSYSKQPGSLAAAAMWCKGEKACPEWNEALKRMKAITEETEHCGSGQASIG